MKTNTSIFALAATTIIGCGFCCLPFLLPLIAGTASISIFNLSRDETLCGAMFVALTLLLAIFYVRKKRKNTCEVSTDKK